ncbi:MAG TPA: hypothetical protein VGW35_19620 [Methylomirabilota bacterium]|nr:hypothetical protein [Methylomirabilota bacterium]
MAWGPPRGGRRSRECRLPARLPEPAPPRQRATAGALEHRHDLKEGRAFLEHACIDTTQIYTKIRPQVKRAVAFYEAQAPQMLRT